MRWKMMGSVEVETREYKIRHIGQEIIDGIPLGGTAKVFLMAMSPSPVEERPTKNRPSQNIGFGVTKMETVYQLYQQTWDCRDG